MPILADGGDLGDEAVASSGDVLDQMGRLRGIAKRFPQHRNVVGEIGLLDEGFRPDAAEQFVLADQASAPFHQGEKHVEGLGRQRDRLSGAVKRTFSGVQYEAGEVVDPVGHSVTQQSLEFTA